ncbi:MAG: ornithine cyclodeaminase family protein [Bacteroidota bacterium]
MTYPNIASETQLQTLVLTVDDIRSIITQVGLDALMDEMIIRLAQAFRQFDAAKTVVPVRTGFSYEQPHVGLLEWMPLFEKYRQIVVKAVGYHPKNPKVNCLPNVLSTVSAYDPASGHLSAIMDGTFLTALRTGAASAIASQHLALPQSKVLGLIGVGAQAITQLHGLSRCFNLQQILIFDNDLTVSHSFVDRIACLGLHNLDLQVANIEEVASKSDILCTATSVEVGRGPVLLDQGLKPWLHVNAVGADFPGKFEVPLSVLERSFICPDFRDQAIREGECQQLQDVKLIGPELSDVVKQPHQYQSCQQQLTVFDSTGFALEDQVAMAIMLNYATELNVGTLVELESVAEVQNPYSFVF